MALLIAEELGTIRELQGSAWPSHVGGWGITRPSFLSDGATGKVVTRDKVPKAAEIHWQGLNHRIGSGRHPAVNTRRPLSKD